MTLDEVKEKLASMVGIGPEHLRVTMDPKEGNFFVLTVTMPHVGALSTRALLSLLDLGRDSGMELAINPENDEALQVMLTKDPIEIQI